MRDKLGRPQTSVNFGRDDFTPVQWDDTGSVLYLRGDYEDPCLVQRIDNDRGLISWAFGKWDDRASLPYGNDRIIRRN